MNQNPLRILGVLPLLGDPNDTKGIVMLQEAGCLVEVVYFERDHHTGWPPDCPAESLGRIAHGHYLRRIPRLLRTIPALRRAIRRNHLVYASGPDMAYISLLAGLGLGRPVILRVGDIRELQVARNWKGRLVRRIDGYFVNRCSLLVATASGFIDTYYRRWLGASVPAIIIGNKIDPAVARRLAAAEKSEPPPGRPLIDRPLRIGYFGLLRCEWSWNVLEALARSRPRDVELWLAGYQIKKLDIPRRASGLKNVKFLGEFRSPDDLPSLYGQVDLVWACYPWPGPGDWNWRWARTNRFYDSCLFRKPIIALAGSGDAPEAERYGIGLTIPHESVEDAVRAIAGISADDLSRWEKNLAGLNPDVYLYTTEAAELKRRLTELAGRSPRPAAKEGSLR